MLGGPVAADRFHWRGQDPVRVATGHADAHTAHVDAEPPAGPGIVPAGPIRQAVRRVHSADPRYLCPHRVERRVDARRILSRALREIRLPAAATVDSSRELLD